MRSTVRQIERADSTPRSLGRGRLRFEIAEAEPPPHDTLPRRAEKFCRQNDLPIRIQRALCRRNLFRDPPPGPDPRHKFPAPAGRAAENAWKIRETPHSLRARPTGGRSPWL